MTAVMISIHPKWVAKIASGEKIIEVRKSAPKLETPFKCYIYCTRAVGHYWSACCCQIREDDLWKSDTGKVEFNDGFEYWGHGAIDKCHYLNGKVVGEFVCDEVLTIDCDSVAPFCKEWDRYVDKETCLTAKELFAYSSNICYGWHISDLKIYDKPKALSEFRKPCTVEFNSFACRGCDYYNYHLPLFDGVADLSKSWCSDGSRILKRPPQSWCYVEEIKA